MQQTDAKVVQAKDNGFIRPDAAQVFHDARYFRSRVMADLGRRLTRGLRKR